jgi:type II secretory pathway predicted ATPase ExeA
VDLFENPFRPGAGHAPPYLAGRTSEQDEVRKALEQRIILENVVLTGLRGVGKTVLLETLKPIALSKKWLWVGQDMSESASVSESSLAERLIADLSVLTSTLLVTPERQPSFGFGGQETFVDRPVGYDTLKGVYEATPGLVSDKLKAVMLFVWRSIPPDAIAGIVFAYDEAQNLADHSVKEQYPLSILLDVFQYLQRQQIPFLLILTGLPTLFPKLVEARTYTERMFHVIFLTQLDEAASRDAITIPVKKAGSPINFTDQTVNAVVSMSGGYPYFIQFICREIFDSWLSQTQRGVANPQIPGKEILRKLDNDFFIGRWVKATDRQRQLLYVISTLESCDSEFTVQEAVLASKKMLERPVSASQTNQMLVSLSTFGLTYKNRHGKYSFAVPLLSDFIKRQAMAGAPWAVG